MSTDPRPVVIGVDGSAANAGALRFGVEEARRTGAPLKLVHVVPDYLPVAPMMPYASTDLTEMGTAIIKRSEEQVAELASDLVVEGWVHHGSRPAQLSTGAEGSRLLVIGRDDRPLLERVLRGDTASRLAARATVPMVLVPADWTADEPRGVVLVGVKSAEHAGAAVGDAFGVAAARGARLVVLHAWKLPSAYDDIIGSRVAVDEWSQKATADVEAVLADWRVTYPEVEVEVRVVHDHPSYALVEASREADLVVLARHAHGVPVTHLGGTARAVLRTAHAPVRVVPPGEIPAVAGLVVEESGYAAK